MTVSSNARKRSRGPAVNDSGGGWFTSQSVPFFFRISGCDRPLSLRQKRIVALAAPIRRSCITTSGSLTGKSLTNVERPGIRVWRKQTLDGFWQTVDAKRFVLAS
jgi:hypothetical protein